MLSLFPRSLYGFANDAVFEDQSGGLVSIPFLEPTDVLVCGSTLYACDLAIQIAKTGKKVTMVMDRVNPFFEGITCLRPWVEESAAGSVPEFLKTQLADEKLGDRLNGRAYFNASKAAVLLEDALADAKVRFFYNATVAGALGDNGRLAGVVFGGKTGLFGIEAGAVVDATVESTVARCSGYASEPLPEGPRKARYVVELITKTDPRTVEYTAKNGAKVRANIDYYYADFEMTFDSKNTGPLGLAEDFVTVYGATLDCQLNRSEKRLRGADGYLTTGVDRLSEKNRPKLDNLFVFGPYTIPGNTEGSMVLADPLALFKAFPDQAAKVAAAVQPVSAARPNYEFWNKAMTSAPAPGLVHGFYDHGFDEPGSTMGKVAFIPPQPLLSTTALVAGGGTSGNAAAYTSAMLGTPTVCLERGLELGGTNTLGNVNNLWYGNDSPAFKAYYKSMKATNRGLNATGFFEGLTGSGCKVLFQSVATGVARKGRDIARVYLATPFGLGSIESSYVIDASGDGFIAAWGGNGYRFGGDHDEMTLVASFGGLRPNGGFPIFTYRMPCDERSAFDTMRFLVCNRRNSKLPLDVKHFPPAFFIAPRESRHITGGKTLTYLDVMAGRKFSDAVLRVESIPDMKGLATSDASMAGLVAADWDIIYKGSLPYASLIPTALDNVIIVGKAYSVSHDALCVARMQRDLAAMGMVAAEAVKLAQARKTILRDIPIGELQQTLIAKEIMPADAVAADDLGLTLTAAEAAKQVASKSIDESLIPSAMLALMPRQEAIAALEPYANDDNPAIRRIQAFLGMKPGVDYYVSKVDGFITAPTLSMEMNGGGDGGTGMMPDQGWAPIPAVMLSCLSVIREPRALPLLVSLGNRYDVKDSKVGNLKTAWGYFYSLAFGFERLAGPEGRDPLKRLAGLPVFKDKILNRSDDPRDYKDLVASRFSYLQMALSRALLRCGDPQGAIQLTEFLDEAHIWIARAARSSLKDATGQDFGFDAKAWKDWITLHGGKIKVDPMTKTA